MRAAWVMLGVLWLGCTVQLAGAPCTDDLQCAKEQHCGREAKCMEGARTAEMLGESCRMAVELVAARVNDCNGGALKDYVTVLAPDVVCGSVEASVRAGRQTFRPEEFGACVRSLRQMQCGSLSLETLSMGRILEHCASFVSQVAPGGACANSADCQEGWCSATDKCPGACRAFVPYGGSCPDADQCQAGSMCKGGICRINSGRGGPCSDHEQCEPNSNTYCQGGFCVDRKTSGSCKDHVECAFRHKCVKLQPDQGDDSPKECRPVKKPGEACEPGADECGLLSYCDAATRACRGWPVPGERCIDPDGTGETVACLEGRCDYLGLPAFCKEDPTALGGICISILDCGPSATCRNSRCVPLWCE